MTRYLLTRSAFLLTAVLVLFFAHWLESGRGIAIMTAAIAIVSALAHYGHQSVTLYLAERHRALMKES